MATEPQPTSRAPINTTLRQPVCGMNTNQECGREGGREGAREGGETKQARSQAMYAKHMVVALQTSLEPPR